MVSERERADYRRALKARREAKSPEPIANRYPWQGELAIKELLELAKAECEKGQTVEIRILTGTAPDRVYGSDAPQGWHDFIGSGGRVKVLVWGDSTGKCGDLVRTLYHSEASVELRLSGTNELADRLMHFVLVGNRAYRLEAPHRPFEEDTRFTDLSPEIPARICFNDTANGQKLVERFDTLWDFCDAVPRESAPEATAPSN